MRIDGNNTDIFNQKDYKQENENLNNTSMQSNENHDNKLDKSLSNAFSLGFDQLKNSDILNEKVLYASEDNLEDSDKFTKNILDNIINQFFGNNQDISMFPNSLLENSSDIFEQNPYNTDNDISNHSGMVVGVTQEYYQKTTIDFNASLTIQTPNSTFEMEISISITQEIYMSKSSTYDFDEAKTLEPITLHHDKDENPFGDLETLHFIFDKNKEDEDTLTTSLQKMLELFNSYDEAKAQKDQNNIINIYSEKFESSYELASIVDTNQGKAVYLSSAQMSYSYESINYQSSSMNNENLLDISI